MPRFGTCSPSRARLQRATGCRRCQRSVSALSASTSPGARSRVNSRTSRSYARSASRAACAVDQRAELVDLLHAGHALISETNMPRLKAGTCTTSPSCSGGAPVPGLSSDRRFELPADQNLFSSSHSRSGSKPRLHPSVRATLIQTQAPERSRLLSSAPSSRCVRARFRCLSGFPRVLPCCCIPHDRRRRGRTGISRINGRRKLVRQPGSDSDAGARRTTRHESPDRSGARFPRKRRASQNDEIQGFRAKRASRAGGQSLSSGMCGPE